MEDTDTGWKTQTDSLDRRHIETVRIEDTDKKSGWKTQTGWKTRTVGMEDTE